MELLHVKLAQLPKILGEPEIYWEYKWEDLAVVFALIYALMEIKEERQEERKMILGFSGSPQENGNLERLIKKLMEEIGGESKFIRIKGLNIRPCLGCVRCAKDNRCIQEDDMKPLYDQIVKADVFILVIVRNYTFALFTEPLNFTGKMPVLPNWWNRLPACYFQETAKV